jgi:hypothetical protein
LRPALAAKHFDKPVYALAESFKFLRLFPLSQQDLPASKPFLTFDEPDPDADFSSVLDRKAPSRVLTANAPPVPFEMTLEQLEKNPLLGALSAYSVTGTHPLARLLHARPHTSHLLGCGAFAASSICAADSPHRAY